MKLYMVHCGFYDSEICDGIYESHANFFVAAESFVAAKFKAKHLVDFKGKRMHIDGIQEVQAVDGFRVDLSLDESLCQETKVINFKHRDLATKPTTEN